MKTWVTIFAFVVAITSVFMLAMIWKQMNLNRAEIEEDQRRMDRIIKMMDGTQKNIDVIAKQIDALNHPYPLVEPSFPGPPPFCGSGDPCDSGAR